MKKSLIKVAILAVATATLLASCGAKKNDTAVAEETKQEEKLVLKMAHNQTSLDNPYVLGAEAFKEKLEQLSSGNIEVELYHGTMDQDEAGLMNSLDSGNASIVVVSPSLVEIPEVDMFSIDYLFDNFAHWQTCLDGDFGQELSSVVTQKTDGQVRILGYWSAGVRNYYGKKPIKEPSDLKGLTIRISNSPVQHEFWEACGAIPKSVSWGELYDALNNDQVDSAENDYTNFSLKDHHKAKNGHYICETEHDFTTRFFLMDGKLFDSLSQEQQDYITQAAAYATDVERQRTFEQASESKAKVIADGAEVTEASDIDIAAFKAIAEPIAQNYAQTNGMQHYLDLVNAAR